MQIHHPGTQEEENPVSKYVQHLMSNLSCGAVVDYADNPECDPRKLSHLIVADESKLIDPGVDGIYITKLLFDLRCQKGSEKNSF